MLHIPIVPHDCIATFNITNDAGNWKTKIDNFLLASQLQGDVVQLVMHLSNSQ